MKKSYLIPFFVLSCHCVFSQDSLQKNRSIYSVTNTGSPLIVIKGDEIRRFPSDNFLDAVNGLFPWIFSQTPDANNFLFVVNGFILQDINGLSLYDIDEVIFTRNNLDGSLYPLSRAGIFYIKTKTVTSRKPVIDFNSQYNIQWNKRSALFFTDGNIPYYYSSGENRFRNRPGGFFSNQVSLAAGSSKFHLYVSAQLDEIKAPPLHQQAFYNLRGTPGGIDTFAGNQQVKRSNLKTFLNLEYHFTDRLKAGITANYFHGHTKEVMNSDINPAILGYITTDAGTASSNLNYYHLGSFINWDPLEKLRNKLYFEYADDHFDNLGKTDRKEYLADYSLAYQVHTETSTTPYDKKYLLRDQLEYDLLSGSKFKLTGIALFSYLHNNVFYKTISVETRNNFPSGASEYRYNLKGKFTSLNPMIRFSFSDFLSGHVGYAFILNKGVSRFGHYSRSNPYAGLDLDIKKLIKINSTVSRLDFSLNYGDMAENTSNNYWLPAITDDQFYPSGQINAIYTSYQPLYLPNPSLSRVILKNKLTAFRLNSGFLGNRLLAGAEWSDLQLQRIFLVRFPIYPNITYIAFLGKEIQKGLALFVSGKLIDKPGREWNMRFNMLFPHINYSINESTIKPDVSPVNYTLQAGLQNSFRFDGWYIQANALYGLNRQYYVTDNSSGQQVQKNFNEFLLNYILLGYDLSQLKNHILRDMRVFVHGRNLLSSKKAKEYYQYNSFGGIGLNVRLK